MHKHMCCTQNQTKIKTTAPAAATANYCYSNTVQNIVSVDDRIQWLANSWPISNKFFLLFCRSSAYKVCLITSVKLQSHPINDLYECTVHLRSDAKYHLSILWFNCFIHFICNENLLSFRQSWHWCCHITNILCLFFIDIYCFIYCSLRYFLIRNAQISTNELPKYLFDYAHAQSYSHAVCAPNK